MSEQTEQAQAPAPEPVQIEKLAEETQKQRGVTQEESEATFKKHLHEHKKEHNSKTEGKYALELEDMIAILKNNEEEANLSYKISALLPITACPTQEFWDTLKYGKDDRERLGIQVAEDPKTAKLFEQVPVDFVRRNSELVVIDSKASVPSALATLAMSGILSAPVIYSDGRIVIGVVDVLDLVKDIMNILKFGKSEKELEKRMVYQVIGADPSNLNKPNINHGKWMSVRTTDRLLNAMRFMGTGLHRVMLSNIANNLVGVISQSDVIQLFSKYPYLSSVRVKLPNADQPQELRALLVKDLPFVKSADKVIKVGRSLPVWQVLECLWQNEISGVAVVDNDSKLVGSFSANHIKALDTSTFHYLLLPVEKYLTLISSDPSLWATSCNIETTTFAELVHLIVSKRAHRVWLVTSDNTLRGLISLTDIIRFLFIVLAQ